MKPASWRNDFCLILCVVIFVIGATPVRAKNLDSRWGFGASLPDLGAPGAITAKYWFGPYVAATGLLGISTDTSKKALFFGGRFERSIHVEENLSFFLGAGLYLVGEHDTAGAYSSGIGLDGLFGAEFFLPGLPNLSFQVETGIGMRSLKSLSFKTLGSGLLGIGFHYYF